MKPFCGAEEVIFPARDDGRKQTAAISVSNPTTGFDHVGLHHWLDLPPLLPELSGGRAKAERILGLKIADRAFRRVFSVTPAKLSA
jgi:hypothetical protein